MTQGDGGTMLEEPPHESRRERREKARPSRRSARSSPTPESEPESPGLSPRQARRLRDKRRRFWFILMPVVAVLLALSVVIGMAIRSDSDSSSSGPSASGRGPGGAHDAHRRSSLTAAPTIASTSCCSRVRRRRRRRCCCSRSRPRSRFRRSVPRSWPTFRPTATSGLLATTVENLLGVKVDTTVVLDDAGLNAALAPAAPLTVELWARTSSSPVPTEAPIPQGTEQLPHWCGVALLVARQTGSELDRLVTVQDVLDAWMDRLRTPSIAKRTVAVQPELAGDGRRRHPWPGRIGGSTRCRSSP